MLTVFLLALATFAQNTPPGPMDPARAREELIAIERRIADANLNCDYKYFSKIEGKDFFFTDANGGTTNRQQDLAHEKNCRKSDATYTVDDPRVALYGDAAVVTGRITIQKRTKDGNLMNSQSRFTDVFLWRDHRWQLVAGHASHIPAEKK